MSPEWMIALDRAEKNMRMRRTDLLSDPLEADAWRGMETVSAFLSRLLNGRGRPAPRRTRQALPDRVVGARAILRRFQARPVAAGALHPVPERRRNRCKCGPAAGTAAMQDPSNGL